MEKELEKMSVNTPVPELMKYIRIHGISTDLETTNKMADIIGNAPISDLAEVANNDKTAFFFLLRFIWSMGDIISFYNEHCNQAVQAMREELNDYEDKRVESIREKTQLLNRINELLDQYKGLEAKHQNQAENMETIKRSRDEYRENWYKANNEVNLLTKLNTELKAAGYDLLQKLRQAEKDLAMYEQSREGQ